MDLDLHVGAELSRCHREPPLCKCRKEALIKWNSLIRWRGLDKRWPAALRCVAVQSKLGDDQHRPADLVQPEIHLSTGIGEQPQTSHLLGHPIYLRGAVAMSESHEQAETPANGAGNPATDGN
jgi:hypothetical protein